MKKNNLLRLAAIILLISTISACSTSQCECNSNRGYKKRKPKVSLINSQKNTTFALQKEMKDLIKNDELNEA
jgi:hypothetical protein